MAKKKYSRGVTPALTQHQIAMLVLMMRRAMLEQGWSVNGLANETGMTKKTIYNVLSGKHKPWMSTLQLMAKTLNVEIGSVLEHNGVLEPNTEIAVMLDAGAITPTRAYSIDAGLDLYMPMPTAAGAAAWAVVPARGALVVDTGVHVAISRGYVGMLKSKSGLNVKHGILSEGVIDAGYTGSIRVKLYNLSDSNYVVNAGDKISQLVIVPCIMPTPVVVCSMDAMAEQAEGERGDKGFGSTGR